ncbi:hypothetical protein AB0L74_32395 [Streptomyces sp. NPDC052020]|uniref:hypothetical protein n=1 Tax=Streptomyces sp. NPDC052020 TaxID=3155677 RepID=UPI00344350AB
MRGDYAPRFHRSLNELPGTSALLGPAHDFCANALEEYASRLQQAKLQSATALERGLRADTQYKTALQQFYALVPVTPPASVIGRGLNQLTALAYSQYQQPQVREVAEKIGAYAGQAEQERQLAAQLARQAAQALREAEVLCEQAIRTATLQLTAVDAEAREPTVVDSRTSGGDNKALTGAGSRGRSTEGPPSGNQSSGGRLAQERGRQYEDFLKEKLGGGENFRQGGREFDGTFQENGDEIWYEAKSGNFWKKAAEDSRIWIKFTSNIGDARRIAEASGKKFYLISENPIPQNIIEWLTKKGLSWKIIPMN